MFDSYHSRLNSSITLLLSALGIYALFNLLTGAPLHRSSPIGSLTINQVLDFRPQRRFNSDQVTLAMQLSADLKSVFNWNTKLLFLSVVAEYATPKATVNEVTVWDHIVESAADSTIPEQVVVSKYPLRDKYSGHLKNADVTFKLRYHRVPTVGPLTQHELARTSARMPENYNVNYG